MGSGAARSTPINDKTDRQTPSAWRTGTRKTRRSVNAVSIAQSENVFGAPGRPDGDGRHASVASARAPASRPLAGPRPARTLTHAPRDTSSCTSDGPLISCRDRAPAPVTVAREPTAASSQPKGCAPTPRRGSTVSCRPPQNWLDTRDSCSQAMRSQRNPVRFTTAARATVEPSVAGPTRHPAADADETP